MLSWVEFIILFQGAEGNKLEHAMGAKTEALSPPLVYVPWIVINGEHTYELQNEAWTDLVALVCKLYKVRVASSGLAQYLPFVGMKKHGQMRGKCN